MNRYSYCRNNPLRYTDPTGHYDDEDNNGDTNLFGYPDADDDDLSENHEGNSSQAGVIAVPVAAGGEALRNVRNVVVVLGKKVPFLSAAALVMQLEEVRKKMAEELKEKAKDALDGDQSDVETSGPKRGVGGKGWRGDKNWRDQVRDVGSGGDVDIDPTPSVDEAKDLIDAAGGSVDRVDSDGHPPGGVSTHTYPHINYTTPNGNKGTIRIR